MALAINLEADVYDEILFPLFELVMGEKLVDSHPQKAER
jgi:hypothetical protein